MKYSKSVFTTRRVLDDLIEVRQVDRDTLFFEAMWEIPEGILYNSYLLLTGNGVVVFDSVKIGYCDEYIDEVSRLVDLRDIKYIVSHHGEPDHSGCVKELSTRSNATILGHPLLGKMLKNFYGVEKFKPLGDGESVNLGSHTLVFHHVPWLHWPETSMTYIPEKKYLFSCDVFGSYGVFEETYFDELTSDKRELYVTLLRKYLANIIGYYRDWIIKNIEKLKSRGVNPEHVFPAHGLIYRGDSVDLVIDLYTKWSRGEPVSGKLIVLYTSMYGFVERAVRDLVDKLREIGVDPVIYVFNDKERGLVSDFIGQAYDSEALLLATSTYDAMAFPYMKFITEILSKKAPRDKKIVVLAAHGWGPRAGQEIRDMLLNNGFKDIKLLEFPAGLHESAVREAFEYIKKILHRE